MRLLPVLSACLVACSGTSATDAGSACHDSTKSPANVTDNPGFECGDTSPSDWSAVYGSLSLSATGRTGRAARVTVDASGGRFASTQDFKGTASSVYCFAAWARGTTPYMRLRVLKDLGSGNVVSFDFNAPVTSTWARVPASYAQKVTYDNAQRLQLVFEAQTGRSDGQNAKPGDTLEIDDVDVWVSPSGNCDERA